MPVVTVLSLLPGRLTVNPLALNQVLDVRIVLGQPFRKVKMVNQKQGIFIENYAPWRVEVSFGIEFDEDYLRELAVEYEGEETGSGYGGWRDIGFQFFEEDDARKFLRHVRRFKIFKKKSRVGEVKLFKAYPEVNYEEVE